MALARLRSLNLRPCLLSSPQEGTVYQLPSLLSPTEAARAFDALTASSGLWRTEVDAFGRQQRETAYFGDDGALFSYVGLRLRPRAWPDAIAAVRERVELVAAAHGTRFTACLANHYGECAGSIPWHSDEVRAHGATRLVLALSLGGERRMLLRQHRRWPEANSPVLSLRLPSGSAVAMADAAQEHWQHALPLDIGAPRRISLTFRSIELGFEEGREPPRP